MKRPTNRSTDRGYLFGLSQGLRPGQNIFRSGVSVLAQGTDRDGGNISFVNRGCRNIGIWPTHDIAGANLRSPPAQGVCGEHSWPQECPFNPRGLDELLYLLNHDSMRIWLLEERMWRFDWS